MHTMIHVTGVHGAEMQSMQCNDKSEELNLSSTQVRLFSLCKVFF